MNDTNPTAPLVSAVDVKVHFKIAESFLAQRLAGATSVTSRAVDGLSLDVYPGETVGLVGESGCGKSTFGRTTVGLLPPTAGQVLFDGEPIWGPGGRLSHRALRQRAQIVFQNPYSSLNPRYTVAHTIGVALSARGVPRQRRRQEAVELIERVGLSRQHLDRYPHQLSGGQRQRVGIARALAMHPDYIVADEPLSSLDVSVQAQIIALLQDLQAELGLAYLLIAHDLGVVYHMCNRVAVMYAGQIVELAPTDQVYGSPGHPYTLSLLAAVPGRRRRSKLSISPQSSRRWSLARVGAGPGGPGQSLGSADPDSDEPTAAATPAGCRYYPRCPRRQRVCLEQEPELKPATGVAPAAASTGASIGIHLVRCHFPGQ